VFGGACRLRFGILGMVSVCSGLLRQSILCSGVPFGMVSVMRSFPLQLSFCSGVPFGMVSVVSWLA